MEENEEDMLSWPASQGRCKVSEWNFVGTFKSKVYAKEIYASLNWWL